jgi:2-hydroxychromene-2-carboxylate isomerase|eukprot:g1255.t1
MASKKSIYLFYDCLSPFSYFAFKCLRRYEHSWNCNLVLKPVLLGGIMAATKNVPPAVRPWAAHTKKVSAQDMERNKKWFNVPNMKPMPSNFFGPKGPADKSGLARDMRYMRLATAVSLYHPDALGAVTDGLFGMIYEEERDERDRVVITETRLENICVASGIAKGAAKEVVDAISTEEVKGALKHNVLEALELGAYGAPFMVCEGQVYFGSDRMEQLAFTHELPWYGPDPERPSIAKL